MLEARKQLLNAIDIIAEELNNEYIEEGTISLSLINSIIDIYKSAQTEEYYIDNSFETAYHTAITGELEFLISRILYHHSRVKLLGWKILLRRQEKRTVPDIRILKDDTTIAIIEIKAKGGWIQPFLSPERYRNDRKRKDYGESNFEPDELIAKQRAQLFKYQETFSLSPDRVFYFIPTMASVHRKKYKTELQDYLFYFEKNSGLPKSNLILLSSNLRLDLSKKKIDYSKLNPMDRFESMIQKLELL